MKEKPCQQLVHSAPGAPTISLQPETERRQHGVEHGPAHLKGACNGSAHSPREHAADWGGQMRPQDGVPLPAAALLPYIPTVTSLDPLLVFDRTTLRQRRERAARDWERHDFLKREIAERLVDRLADVRRTFPLALDLGSHGDEVAAALGAHQDGERTIVEQLVRADLGRGFAARARGPAVVADEEFLPFAAGRFDLVLSAMDLHWVNDLPGTLIQIARILKPDGLFLGALLGGATLWQLRQALAAAESEIDGG